jgi:hypothetical protein
MIKTPTGPVGELKKIVSLIDRSAFDDYVYPSNAERTRFQPDFKPYHNFVNETVVWPFSGKPAWGQRITFSVPWPWQADFLNTIALRMKPLSWMPPNAQRRIGPEGGDWVPVDTANFWIWAQSLGSAAIERAQMEVDGVIIEEFSGDYINVWNKTMNSVTSGVAFDDGVYNSVTARTINQFLPSEDGYVYCHLPFWFARHQNTAFPLLSCTGPDRVRFHITLRPFKDVVRKLGAPRGCDETPVNQTCIVRDYNFPFRKNTTVQFNNSVPEFESLDFLCTVSHIDGPLREAYINRPHELMMSPIVETTFAEPLKYTVNKSSSDTIQIGLPLTMINGPIQQLVFFLRRNAAVSQWNDWNNYSAMLENEGDPVWNPVRPLLVSAQLLLGTAVWMDAPERVWRAQGNIQLPGGIRGYGNYIYAYNFADAPQMFDPSGSANASRVDMRLNLTVAPPGGAADGEWSVHIFALGRNWIRFQNGLANLLFMD